MAKGKYIFLVVVVALTAGCLRDEPVNVGINNTHLVGSWFLEENITETDYTKYRSVYLYIEKDGESEYFECVNEIDGRGNFSSTSHKSITLPESRVIKVSDVEITLELSVSILNIEYDLRYEYKNSEGMEYLTVEGHDLRRGELSRVWSCPDDLQSI